MSVPTADHSIPVQVRLFLSQNPGFHKSADVASALGLETKSVSSALSRLLKQERVVREDGAYADPTNTEAPAEVPTPAEPVPSEDLVESAEDLIGEVAQPEAEEAESEEEETAAEPLFYEFLDFPGNYSIVMAPFAVEIADAAGVPAKIETFKGKLTRRVHFGGTDMDLTSRTVSLVQESAEEAMAHLHDWQHKHAERRRGLTDMQRYLEHREVLAKYGHKVARQVKKEGI